MSERQQQQRRRQFGSVRRLPSGQYQARYRGPDGKLRSAGQTFATKTDASIWLDAQRTAIINGDWRPPEPARETFGSYARRWLAQGVGRDLRPLSPTTAALYRHLWRRWLEPAFGDIALGDLTTEQFRTWFADAQARDPGSLQPAKAYRLARAILNVAVDDAKIKVNPCRVRGAGREHSPERPVAAPDEVLRIAGAIDQRYRAMVILGAWCSLRFGELAGLRRGRIDLLHRRIEVVEQLVEPGDGTLRFRSPKWDSARHVEVPAEVVEVIEEHLARHVGPEPDALVFTSATGKPLRRSTFRSHWTAACEKAGMSGLHFHDLRGSGATWAAPQGASLAELMHRLGHRTDATALRYQHATDERRRHIADRLGALLRAAEAVEPEPAVEVRPIR